MLSSLLFPLRFGVSAQWLISNGATFPKIQWPARTTVGGVRGTVALADIEVRARQFRCSVRLCVLLLMNIIVHFFLCSCVLCVSVIDFAAFVCCITALLCCPCSPAERAHAEHPVRADDLAPAVPRLPGPRGRLQAGHFQDER